MLSCSSTQTLFALNSIPHRPPCRGPAGWVGNLVSEMSIVSQVSGDKWPFDLVSLPPFLLASPMPTPPKCAATSILHPLVHDMSDYESVEASKCEMLKMPALARRGIVAV
jgi:hypothetical protein